MSRSTLVLTDMLERPSVLIKRSRDLEMRVMTKKEYWRRVHAWSNELDRVRRLSNQGEHREYESKANQIGAQINYYARYEDGLVNE